MCRERFSAMSWRAKKKLLLDRPRSDCWKERWGNPESTDEVQEAMDIVTSWQRENEMEIPLFR